MTIPIIMLLIVIVLLINNSLLIITKTNNFMAKLSEFQVQMDRLNESTNQMAAMLTSLKDQIAGAGMPQEVEDSILAQLTKAADTLSAMANPKAEEPVEEVPEEEAVVAKKGK